MAFHIDKYEKQHKANLLRRAQMLSGAYNTAINDLIRLGMLMNVDKDKDFFFSLRKGTEKQVKQVQKRLSNRILSILDNGEKEAFILSKTKSVDMVNEYLPKVREKVLKGINNRTSSALRAFQTERDKNMNLSGAVWDLTEELKEQMELSLQLGIHEGTSAKELATECRRYLNEPNKLFRRVRDAFGVLRLSKSAKAYHPGRGVYRSSYKNALRMTNTEINMAYRTADHYQWKEFDFVRGIEIKVSDAPHVRESKHLTDICDELQGIYPKTFKFIGWHPNCRCFAVPVLVGRDDMRKYSQSLLKGEEYKFDNIVSDMPDNFKGWVKDNESKLAHMAKHGKSPYFISRNKKIVEGILRPKELSAILKPKNPLTEEQKKRRDEIFEYAKKNMKHIEIKHPQINEPIKLYTKSIKEWLNQPHKYYFDKNEMLLNIENVLSKSKYVGVSNYKDRISHIFEVELRGEKSWILVNYKKERGYAIYSISDNETILTDIRKPT